MEILSRDGQLLATLLRRGGGRTGRPVEWLVYWALRYSDMEARRFRTRLEAAAWVRSVERTHKRATGITHARDLAAEQASEQANEAASEAAQP